MGASSQMLDGCTNRQPTQEITKFLSGLSLHVTVQLTIKTRRLPEMFINHAIYTHLVFIVFHLKLVPFFNSIFLTAGRAEALLIAAYGKGLKLDSSSLSTELVPSNEEVIISNYVTTSKEWSANIKLASSVHRPWFAFSFWTSAGCKGMNYFRRIRARDASNKNRVLRMAINYDHYSPDLYSL